MQPADVCRKDVQVDERGRVEIGVLLFGLVLDKRREKRLVILHAGRRQSRRHAPRVMPAFFNTSGETPNSRQAPYEIPFLAEYDCATFTKSFSRLERSGPEPCIPASSTSRSRRSWINSKRARPPAFFNSPFTVS